MKRSELKRKTPLKTKTGLKPGGNLKRTGRLKQKSTTRRSMGKPDPCWRSRLYLGWVKAQPSVISGLPADDPHHIKRPGFGGTVKCSDLFTIPLTRPEHDEFHRIGWKEWEAKYQVNQSDLVLQTIERAVRDGVIQFWVDSCYGNV